MENKIIIKNAARIERKLGVKLSEDWEACVKALGEGNKKYLETYDKDLLREFYEKTGLIIAHAVQVGEWGIGFPRYIFNMHGWTYEGYVNDEEAPIAGRIHDEHILVISSVDKEEDLPAPDEKDLIKWSEEARHKNYELSTSSENKREYYNTFGEHIVLEDDGKLYRDEVLYDENVIRLFSEFSGQEYIIFEDDSVEMLSRYQKYLDVDVAEQFVGKFKKVVSTEHFLAELKDDGKMFLRTVDAFSPDMSVTQYYENVLDVEIESLENDVSFSWQGEALMTKLRMMPEKGKNVELVGAPIVAAPFGE